METTTLKDRFVSRFKSFLWRIGMMFAAFVITFLLDNLNLLHLTPQVTVVAGLILGEISKELNSMYQNSQQA